ncbi:hypothetical protein HUT11_01435 [Streptomyces seoulensis]|nr:hypothetical protein HUT11_01435 [Streptomyces seoulensis]
MAVEGKSLEVVLFEDAQADEAMRVRHRNEVMVAALGAEIEAIIGDSDPADVRRPVRRQSAPVWPVRALAHLRDRLRHGSPWWRRALGYVVLGLPLAVGLPVDRSVGLMAWLLLPASVVLLRMWIGMADLDTRWVMWRRGVTVRARYEPDHANEGSSHLVHFRTLDGRKVTARPALRGRRDEIRYDPEDPSRVLAPTRVAWLGFALAGFLVTGFWGAVFGVPAVLWVIEALSLLFQEFRGAG